MDSLPQLSQTARVRKSLRLRDPRLSNPEKKVVAEGARPSDLENEVAAVKAENAAVREQLRKMEEQNKAMAEQQKALLELVDGLKRQLDGLAIADVPRTAQPLGPAPAAEGPVPSTAAAEASVPSPPAPIQKDSTDDDRYRDGLVLFETKDDDKIPFLLKFNINTQFRYLNTLDSDETFTDHLGNVREVHKRNDLTVNRSMFTFSGYVFDKRLQYSFTVWTVRRGRVNRPSREHWLAIQQGPHDHWQVTTVLQAADHLLTRSHFLPESIGAWRTTSSAPASPRESGRTGNPLKGLYYNVFVGNGLNHPEYLGKQDRYESSAFRQCLVGTAGRLRGTRQITQHVR